MSQENVETVMRGLDAFSRRDAGWAQDHCLEDVLLHPAAASAIEGRTYRGRTGIEEFFREVDEMFESFAVLPDEVRPINADSVVAVGRVRARTSGAGVELDQAWGSVWELRDGRVAVIRTFFDRQQALEAAGLSE